jgi:hypothetical protein
MEPGITSSAPETRLCVAGNGREVNAMARRIQKELRNDESFMLASARGVRAEGDIGGYTWLPQSIEGRIRVNEIWKRHNCR